MKKNSILVLGILVFMLSACQINQSLNQNKLTLPADWIISNENCRIWNPSPKINENISWSGACVGGYAEGFGTVTWFVNRKLDLELKGNYSKGKFNKYVEIIFANGDSYKGDSENGVLQGQGIFIWADGKKYIGEFREGRLHGQGKLNWPEGDEYVGDFEEGQLQGYGRYTFKAGDEYVGEWNANKRNGYGTVTLRTGDIYIGQFKNDRNHGQGIGVTADGKKFEGIWANDQFVRETPIDLPNLNLSALTDTDRAKFINKSLKPEGRPKEFPQQRPGQELPDQISKLSLKISATEPDSNGVVFITVSANTDTSSLKVNGHEEGGKTDGNYTLKRVARAGQDTEYIFLATDVFGNTATNRITVAKQKFSNVNVQRIGLNPEKIQHIRPRDAVAIIIGIQNYKRVPKADFANNDAKEFYEYAVRALGIKPDNIKMLIDEDADDVNIVKAFENWLPIHTNYEKTDVFVFFSGHGSPSTDGKSLYFLPHGVDQELLSRTAIAKHEIVAALVEAKPKSVTMFIDACYSGQARSGEVLLAGSKPVSLKPDNSIYPPNFTVITASSHNQISSASPELKHGIFSFYLMKGLEGDADTNNDGKITVGEMHGYLSDKVSRQAMTLNRKQNTQLVGDATRILTSR